MNTISINIIVSVLLIALFITVLIIKPVSINLYSHRQKIKKASKILEKLKHFPETSKVPRILNYLRKIDPYVFEELLLSAFEKEGYTIKRNIHYSGDGGIDGKVYKNGQEFYIQAKRYNGYIKKQHLLDFIEIIKGQNINGMFIHTGRTGKELFKIVQSQNVEIISGKNLIKLLGL